MKKLIAIIFALITALLVTPNRGVDPSPVAVVNPPQTAITTWVEQVPEESETTAETVLVSETEEAKPRMKPRKQRRQKVKCAHPKPRSQRKNLNR